MLRFKQLPDVISSLSKFVAFASRALYKTAASISRSYCCNFKTIEVTTIKFGMNQAQENVFYIQRIKLRQSYPHSYSLTMATQQ